MKTNHTPPTAFWLVLLVTGALFPAQAQTPPSLLQLAFPEVFARGDGPPAADSPAPLLLSHARTRGNPNAVEVVFSAPVAEATATNKINYAITPGVTVLGAAMGTNTSTVILATTTMPNGVQHLLTVNNVQDRATPPNTIATNSQVFILKAQGVITRRVFTGIGGNWLNSLTNHAKFPNAPDGVDWPASFEVPSNIGDYYGDQVLGFVHPPVTGDYMFYIASDNEGLLYLSTNDNAANKLAIARVPDNNDGARQWTKYASQQSAYFRLEAGKAYYIEALMAESTGNDYLAVAWRLRGMPAPANGDSPVPGDFLSSITPSAPVSIVTPPQNQTVAERQPASFSVVPTGTPSYRYQWQRNGVPIPGATATNYAVASTTLSDHGAQFSVEVQNGFSRATSSAATLTVRADTNPPALFRLSGSATMDKITLAFTEPVTPLSANNAANYTLSGGLGVLGARLMPDQTNLVLATTPQTAGASYTVTVAGVKDESSAHNSASTSSNFTAWVLGRGFLHRDVFYNLGSSSGALADLTANLRFPDFPDAMNEVTSAETPNNIADGFGQRLVGFLRPPTTGYYIFHIAADDQGQVFLSPDTNAANKVPLCWEPAYNPSRYWTGTDRRTAANPENISAPVYLQAGQRYYFEALQREAYGGDNLGVLWRLPGAPPPVNGDPPIGAAFLECFANPVGASLSITQQPVNVSVAESFATNFTVGITSSYAPVFYQWQRNGADIPGANTSSYTTPRLLRADAGARYRCVVAIPGTQIVSAEATVAITRDNTAPQALSAATLVGSTNIGLCFNELMDPAAVTNPANYTLNNGGLVTGAALRPEGQSVWLGVSLLSFTNYTVRLNNLKDYAGNPLPANTTVPVSVNPMENTDIGIAGDPLEIGSTFSCSSDNFDVIAGGSDIWNTRDGFHYVYQNREGDFDARVRVARLDLKQTYTFAGIVVRENLSPGSRNLRIHLFATNGANGYHASTRTTQDGSTAQTMGICCGPVPYPNAWLRLTRTNDTFVGWRGTNGVDWTSFVTMTMSYTGRVYVGMAACPVNNNAGQATTAWFRDWSISPDYPLPGALDLQVKRATEAAGAFALNQVYQVFPVGAQILSETATPAAAASFTVKVENDAAVPQSLLLRAVENTSPGWTVTYRLGLSNVTALITNTTGFSLSSVPPGSADFLTVDLLPDSRVLGGARKTTTLSVTTDRYTRSLRDAAQLVAYNQINYQPDMLVRRLNDVVYAGEGVFNLTGSNQTKHVKLAGLNGATFPLKLINAGNITNTFQLTATAGSGGWDVRYFDALTGSNDLSADIAGGGVFVTLIPGGSFDFRAEVRAGAAVPSGETNSLRVMAQSTGGGANADAVRMIIVNRILTNAPQKAVYTVDADFEQGALVGTTYGGDQLTLAQQSVTQPFLWVPNSNEGTVSKIDIFSGAELGRYRTAPQGVTAEPSRTTIDQYGDCYVANRQCSTVVKIGLLENGEFRDRNGNGVADTSRDTNYDGNITGGELLPFGQDECVLYEVVVIPGKEGTYVPGTYTGGYANDYWNPGPRSMAVDFLGNLWAGCWGSMKFYYVDGPTGRIELTNEVSSVDHHPYGAVVDSYGIIWSSGYHETVSRDNVLRLDPTTGSFSNVISGRRVYGLAIDRNDHLFITSGDGHLLTRYNVLTNGVEWTANDPGNWTKGAAVGLDGDLWVANESDDTATRWSNDGVRKTVFPIGDGPTGPAVDAAGKIWVVNRSDETIRRIDPATDSIDLTKRIIGGTHYGYSDMTGVIARNVTARFGTWTALHDAGVQFTQWGKLTWNAGDPSGAGVRIRVRSTNDGQHWSAWERATNGLSLVATPPGQFLQIDIALTCRVHDPAPVLYDLTVEPLPQRTADLAISQFVSPNPVTNEHQITWTVTVTNRGPQDARGVFVTNGVPAGLALVSLTNSQGAIAQTTPFIRWNVGELALNTNATLTVVAVAARAGTFTNTAYVAHYEQDPGPGNNFIASTLEILPIPCLPPPPGLVTWWPGDDTTADILGTNAAANVGGVIFTNARVGRGFRLNGSSYLRATASPELHVGNSPDGFTVEMWLNPDDVSGAHTLAEWYGTSAKWGVHFWVSGWNAGAGNLGAAIPEINGTYHNLVSPPGKLVAGVWQHVALTYDRTSGQATIHLNGTNIVTSNLGKYVANTATDFYIGARTFESCCYFRGVMDEVSLYTRALSQTEIQAIIEAGGTGKCGGGPLPSLKLLPVSGDLYNLAWPAAAAGFQPQFSDVLGGGWQALGGTPTVVGDENTLPVRATNVTRFYRLKK